MKYNLAMDFSVDKENHTITVKESLRPRFPWFGMPLHKSEILDLWWAPKPWKTRTKIMDFREGGHWHYAMVGPAGENHWCFANYLTIDPQKGFTGMDGFADEHGNVNKEMPQSKWNIDFTSIDKGSLVSFQIVYNDLAQLEMTLQMGFKDGLATAMEGLDEIFASKSLQNT